MTALPFSLVASVDQEEMPDLITRLRQGEREAIELVVPRGRAEVRAVRGGLNVHDAQNGTTHVIATAAIEAWVPVDAAAWRLTTAG